MTVVRETKINTEQVKCVECSKSVSILYVDYIPCLDKYICKKCKSEITVTDKIAKDPQVIKELFI